MNKTTKYFCAVFLVLMGVSLRGASICGPDGLQESGSIYRICMPTPGEYNNRLVIFAHGFQDAGTPVEIPEDQLVFGGVSISELVNGLGFGFATNSYSKTGLAVRQGMEDVLDLVGLYTSEQGAPERVYLVGASEGGIITALSVEQHPDIYSAGLAACGPVGDFPFQMNYFGDARATFEYFFPAVIPGDPFDPPAALVENWSEYYGQVVEPTIFHPSNRTALQEWFRVARLPVDPGDLTESTRVSARDVLRYAVVNLIDAAQTLGGFPFDNSSRVYVGSNQDAMLNLLVRRRTAEPAAIVEMEDFYNTTGVLDRPLITLHTTSDQQVPYAHEYFYKLKTLANGTFLSHHLNLPVVGYGHCDFSVGQALAAFAIMLAYADDFDVLNGVDSILQDSELRALQEFVERGEGADLEGPHPPVVPKD